MTDRIYIRPIGFVPGPQSEHGNAIRLAGGMVYASRFAVILRREGQIAERWLAAPDTMAEVLAALPEEVGADRGLAGSVQQRRQRPVASQWQVGQARLVGTHTLPPLQKSAEPHLPGSIEKPQ